MTVFSILATVFVLVVLFGATEQADPQKPTWPSQFVVPFGLNDPLLFIRNSSAKFYYNWDQVQSQLLDYETHCFPLAHLDAVFHPCKLFFNPKGIFLSLPADKIDCCLFVDGVGAVPPNFLRGFNYSQKNETVPDMYGKQHNCYLWDGEDDFKYWTDADKGIDVQFQDGPSGVKWNFGSMIVQSQDPSIFTLPAGDCSKSCGLFGDYRVNDAFVSLSLMANRH